MLTIILGAYGFAAKGISEAKKDSEERAKRIYERFDEYKKTVENRIDRTCVVKDMCTVMHTNSDTNMKRLEEQMKEGFLSLGTKFEELQKMLFEAKNVRSA